MMLGFLLARAGIDVIVLEKHADFLRDFRGDTIHPSTLEIMHELGLLEEFLKLPHEKVHQLNAQIGDTRLTLADFSHLPTRCGFIAFMPQWDFLDFLADHARRYPTFRLLMEAEVTDIVKDGERVAGLRAQTPAGSLEVRADLVVAADGRQSIVREKADLPVQEFGAPMDVLWFRLSRKPDHPAQTMGRFDTGRIFITINRGNYWQCGYVIPKGQFDGIRRQGLDSFHEKVVQLAPYAKDQIRHLDAKCARGGRDRRCPAASPAGHRRLELQLRQDQGFGKLHAEPHARLLRRLARPARVVERAVGRRGVVAGGGVPRDVRNERARLRALELFGGPRPVAAGGSLCARGRRLPPTRPTRSSRSRCG